MAARVETPVWRRLMAERPELLAWLVNMVNGPALAARAAVAWELLALEPATQVAPGRAPLVKRLKLVC
jgi:hypothetical protein